jgi:hypothetical protein
MEEAPSGETGSRVRVVRDQVDGGSSRGERTNPLVCEPLRLFIRPDAVEFPPQQQILRSHLPGRAAPSSSDRVRIGSAELLGNDPACKHRLAR